MNKKKIIQSVVASALCVAMVLSIVLGALFLMPSNTIQAASAEGNNFDFKFKKSDGSNVSISFIGDSITTYSGVSNNTSYNSTIGGNAVYYGRTSHAHYSEFADVKLADTWWMQTIDTLGLDLCVNNSWSASKIITLGGSTATQKSDGSGYYERCYNLHNDKTGKQPDIIVVFLGTNDCGSREDPSSAQIYGKNTLPTVDIKHTDSGWVPGTIVGAYAGMIRRICATYPNAEIYCCNLLPQQDERLSNNKQVYDKFNAGVKEVIDGYSTGKDPINGTTIYKHWPGIHLVDFYNESGIHQDKQSRENCYANRLHPNKKGMDAMSNLLISELMEHSKYMPSDTVDVTYDLANTFVEVGNVTSAGQAMYGDVTRAVIGKPFQVTINTKGEPNIDYRVTMGGQDITSSVVHGDTIAIPRVTGDITIRAHEFDYFYWNAGKGGLESAHDSDESISANSLSCFYNDGAYSVVDGAANFDSAGRAYKMSEPINLLHDRNWELEFSMSGQFNNGALLLSYASTSNVWDLDVNRYVKENNVHLFRTGTNGMLAFGVTTERDNDYSSSVSGETYKDYYYHYGVGLTNAKYGGNASFDVNAMHTYRMFNVYDAATGGNTIYLSIDGGTPIAMTYSAIAHKLDHTNRTSTYEMSGRDLTFNCIGTWDADRVDGSSADGHPLRNCRIEYIKVKENGDPVTYNHDPSNYYWEFQQSGVVSNPEGLQVFTDNKVTVAQGAYAANGNFGHVADTATQNSLKLAQPAVLLASRPWILEFQSGGSNAGGILLTSDLTTSNQGGNSYIHMNQSTLFFGISQKHKNNHYNSNDTKGITYATMASKLGSSAGADLRLEKHIYRMENVINPDGSNHVVLYVDDVMIGDLVQAGSDWSGQDMIINYFGSQNDYGLRNIDLDYIMIYENGIPQEKEDDEIDNFRWDATKDGMTSVKPTEENTYFTENIATIKKGSGVNGIHDLPAYYQLDKTVNLLHDRSWNIEWRASGSWGGTDNSGDDPMLLSSIGTRKKNMTYIWRNASDLIAFGTYNSPGFSNYGIRVSDTEFGELNDGQMYTYRLENRVECDAQGNYISNMVYLWIDGVEIGAMDNYYANNNDQNKKDEWISGRDFAFNYIGNDAYSLLDVNFEYLQIWESGYKIDTRQLEYVLYNWDQPKNYDRASWSNFVKVWTASRNLMTKVDVTQAEIDQAVKDVMIATNAIVLTVGDKNTIYSTELVTGEYARVGKQVGLKVITSPDIAQICVGTQELLTNACQYQEMIIDGEKKTVKVWLVSFKYKSDTIADEEGSPVNFGVGAWTTYSADHDGTRNDDTVPDVYTSIKIPFRSYFVTSITIDGEPEKFIYGYKEEFDPTGIIVTAHFNNGNSVELTAEDYNIVNPVLMPGDTAVTIEFEGATAEVPVTTVANVSQAHWFGFDENDASITEPPVIWVQGIYMGFVADHNSGIYEVIVKDYMSDKMMSVIYYDYDEMLMLTDNFRPGDFIWVQGNIYVDDATNKTCLINAYADSPWSDPDDFVYEPINTRTMHNQGQIDDLFQNGVIKDYQIVNFKGTMYLHRYNTGDRIYYTIHMNPDAEGWDGFGKSIVQLTDDAYQTYKRESILGKLFFEASDEFNMNFEDTGEDLFPGIKVDGQITGVYVYNDGCYQLAVLDANWVSVDSVTDVTIQDAEIIE